VRLLKEFTHFFAGILWLAAALSFVAEWSEPGQGMAKLGYAIVVIILVSGLFSFWQEYRVERMLDALRKLLPSQVDVLRDAHVHQLPAEQLVPGDVILLEQGDVIPADCRLLEAFSVRVNMATVTGEAMPRARTAKPSDAVDAVNSPNTVLAGTSMVSGKAKALVLTTGMRTAFGRIARLTQTEGETVSPLRLEIAHLSRFVVWWAVAIGAVFFAIARARGVGVYQDFIFAIGIIVAMVPEGLLPTLTLALVLAAQRMAKRHVLIRHLPSVETLGSATVICTDKTGTLTENRMAVRQLFLCGQEAPTAAEAALASSSDARPLLLAAGLCHDLTEIEQEGTRVLVGDPMEVALVELARRALPDFPTVQRLDEIPFDADRMRMSIVYATAEGSTLYCKGAPETVLPLCTRRLMHGSVHALDDAERQHLREVQEVMTERGLRVIALAYRSGSPRTSPTISEDDLVFAGLVGLEDPPRAEVPQAIRRCRQAGIKIIMVTGDHPRTAHAIAREIGLVQSERPALITGDRLRDLSDAELQLALDAPDVIFARVAADQKLRIVQALKDKQQVVAVTGDGVNDAPALKCAQIGIAMGIMGTDVAKEAADMILLDDNFASIVNAIEEGRAVFQNIRRFLTYILAHNVPQLIPYLAFVLFGIPLALTPMQSISIDMGTDSLTALGLGVERPSPQAMQRPPRSPDQRLLDGRLALRAYLFLGVIESVGAMSAFFYVLYGGGWTYGQPLTLQDPLYLRATTACFSAIIVMQIVNVFLCRSATRPLRATGVGGNSLILWGVALEAALVLLIDYTAWGNDVFGTAPISWRVWLFVLPFGMGLLVLEEWRKRVVRRTR